MVGGGSRNALLCRLTAEACERTVLAGPAEATSLGNLLVQAMATGELDSLDALRDVVRRSADVVRYEPEATRVR
jgi:rhamnulokinase